MKKLITFIFILLLCGNALGQTSITSLPTTISVSGDYILNVSDTVTTTAITISANSVNLDMNGHTVGFGSAGGNVNGMYITGDTVYVYDGDINHAVDDTVTLIDINGIYAPGTDFLTLRNVDVLVKGYCQQNDATSQGITGISMAGSGTFMNRVVSCTVSTDCSGFNDRTRYPIRAIAGIRTLSHVLADDSEYHIWVDSCDISSNYLGIQMYGSGIGGSEGYCLVSNSTVEIDARNDGPFIGFRAGNAYGIHMRNMDAFKIWNNVVTYGSTYLGGMGIWIEGVTNDLGFGTYVYDNTCSSSISAPVGGSDDHSTALRIRNEISHLWVYDNDFYAISDDVNDTSGTTVANGMNLGTDGDESWDSVFIHNNKSVVIGDATSEAYALVIASKQPANVFEIYYNNLQSNNVLLQTAKDNDGVSYLLEYEDTLTFANDSGNTMWTYDLSAGGATSWLTDSFLAINNVYLGGASDTNIEISGVGTPQEIQIKYTITLTSNGNNSLPVSSSSAWCVNTNGDTLWQGTTSASGLYTDTVETWYEEIGSFTNYNDMTIGVAKDGDTTTSVVTVGSTNRDFTLVLTATEGAGSNKKKKFNGGVKKGQI